MLFEAHLFINKTSSAHAHELKDILKNMHSDFCFSLYTNFSSGRGVRNTLYWLEKSITFASSCALPWPKNFSTIASANSMEVPGPRLVIRLPSTRTRFSTSL